MNTRSLLILGDKVLNEEESVLRKKARSGLMAVSPSRIITNYEVGWSQIVLEEAIKLGIPYMGVLPYPSLNEEYKNLSKRASSNLIFTQNKLDFLNSPYAYFSWLDSYISEIMVYISKNRTQADIVNIKVLQALKNKTIRNFCK